MREMERYDGYLFAKLAAIGSRSEGPVYFLQQWDYFEVPVHKKVPLFQNDPALHEHLNQKVTIYGIFGPMGIEYDKIVKFEPPGQEPEHTLKLALRPESDVLWINKMPPTRPGRIRQEFDLTMTVEWPYRSIWTGQCPTSQIFEFWIDRPDGEEIWRWSKGKLFPQVITPVRIPGGRPVRYQATWSFDPGTIKEPGVYTAHGLFIASRQTVEAKFEIKFAV